MNYEEPWIDCSDIMRYEYDFGMERGTMVIPAPLWIQKDAQETRFIITSEGTCVTVCTGWLISRAIPFDKEAAKSPAFWEELTVPWEGEE